MRAPRLVLLASFALLGCDRNPDPDPDHAPLTRRAAPQPGPTAVKFVAPVVSDTPPTAGPATSPPAPALAAPPSPAAVPAIPAAVPVISPEGGARPTPAKLASYPPKEECGALPGFTAFRTKLTAAARKRDVEALVALANPDVKLDFGGGTGRDELRKRLGSRPELWGELQEALALGCAADKGLATLPWIFSRMPDDADAYRALLIAGANVPLRERAAADAPVRAELDWALVQPVAERVDPKARFVEVETPDKALRGFVEAGKLRSLLDYRIIAEPQGEGWAISAFIAGD